MTFNSSPSLTKLEHQSLVILGLGREGWSTYQFLRQYLPHKELAIADKKQLADLPKEQQQALQQDDHLVLLLGDDYLEKIKGYEVIFKTPGIPQQTAAIQAALTEGASLNSNTQLFFELCAGVTIGVTGTKGKSTTTALIHHVLKEHGLQTILAGNIGTPMLAMLEEINQDTIVVLELSSHQLDTMTVSPNMAVVQEITTEHLDYFADEQQYQQAKSSITKYQQPEDLVIYNPSFEVVAEIAALSPGKHLRHSLAEGPESVAFVRNQTLMYRNPDQQVFEIIKQSELPLLGKHNLYNVLPAIIVASVLSIPPEEIGEALKSFKSLPHRLELIFEKEGKRYYDDSLATNPHATLSALDSFTQPVVMIAGGYERDQDFTALAKKILTKKVVGLVLFNPTGERLVATLKQLAEGQELPQIAFAKSMAEAVTTGEAMMAANGVMLMSPASASFGMFEDYRDRGLQFQEAVKKL